MEETAEKSILFVLNSISADNCHDYDLSSLDSATKEYRQLNGRNLKSRISFDCPDSLVKDGTSVNERADAVQRWADRLIHSNSCYADFHSLNKSLDR